jgi:hypothetical protein
LIRLMKAKSPENAATVGRNHQSDECGSRYQDAALSSTKPSRYFVGIFTARAPAGVAATMNRGMP